MIEYYRIVCNENTIFFDSLEKAKKQKTFLENKYFTDTTSRINIMLSAEDDNGNTKWLKAELKDFLLPPPKSSFFVFDIYTGKHIEVFSFEEAQREYQRIARNIPNVSYFIEQRILDLFGNEVWEYIDDSCIAEIGLEKCKEESV